MRMPNTGHHARNDAAMAEQGERKKFKAVRRLTLIMLVA